MKLRAVVVFWRRGRDGAGWGLMGRNVDGNGGGLFFYENLAIFAFLINQLSLA